MLRNGSIIIFIFLFFYLILFPISAVSEPVVGKLLVDYPDQITQDGDLVILPAHGTVYLGTDFHGKLDFFERWLKESNLIDQIKAGRDVYGLILGDAIDHKLTEKIPDLQSDAKLVDRVMQLQRELGENGIRLIYLKGNHELAATEIYAMLKANGMNDSNRKELIASLYRSPQGSYFQQFNFIERMNDEQYDFLSKLPVIAVGRNGLVAVHAGTSSTTTKLSDLVQPTEKILTQLLWGRPDFALSGGYTHLQTRGFLEQIGGQFLVVGHTPLSYLPTQSVRDGISRLHDQQVVFTSGHGAAPGASSYLSIDLSKTYSSVSEFKYGVEIHSLFPK